MARFKQIDVERIRLRPNSERESKVSFRDIIDPYKWLVDATGPVDCAETLGLAEAVVSARKNDRPVVLFIAGHVVKHGLSRFVMDLVSRGIVTHVACNGSVLIHDWELAVDGHTSEDVGRYIKDGKFGHWETPSQINQVINDFWEDDTTIVECLGDSLLARGLGARTSIIRCCHKYGVPMTSHILVGGDIIHQHPNCSEKLFAASFTDFLVFAGTIQDLQGGVFINVGSQVTGTEVFLKALSMARNIAVEDNLESPLQITTGMLDFVKLPDDWRNGEASEGDAAYYYRPWKSLLLRTVADGGSSFYISGPHTTTLPNLWKTIITY